MNKHKVKVIYKDSSGEVKEDYLTEEEIATMPNKFVDYNDVKVYEGNNLVAIYKFYSIKENLENDK